MKTLPSWFQWDGEDLLLDIRVQPRASRDEIVGLHDDALKIRITAPPQDGKANIHLIRFLSEVFGTPRSRIELISGQTGRKKRIRIRSPGRLPASLFNN
ncbi:DUF167 family protein [Kaarinaea lacus]